jgi:glycosyltransferase involved in cell wall biosynthesis
MKFTLVAETFPPEINGVSMTLHRLVSGMIGRGHRTEVIRPRQGPHDSPVNGSPVVDQPGERLVPGLPLPGYPDLRIGLPILAGPARRWSEEPPDIVHVATEGPLGWAAARLARRRGIPVTSSFHTNFHVYTSHYGYGLIRNAAFRYLRGFHNRTRCTFVPSATVAETLGAAGFRNLRLLGRGVDTDLFSPHRRDRGLRTRWGVAEGEPLAIYVGRIASEKNMPLLIRTYDAMRAVRPGLRLVVVGDGPGRTQLERERPEIIFVGMRFGDDLARHYASGDIFIFPSTTETFGNVVTEAMSSGLAVLAFDYAAARQHLRSGQNGWTVLLGDDDCFVRGGVELLSGRVQWADLGRAARRTAMALSWDGVVGDFEGELERVRKDASGAKS